MCAEVRLNEDDTRKSVEANRIPAGLTGFRDSGAWVMIVSSGTVAGLRVALAQQNPCGRRWFGPTCLGILIPATERIW
jgi:hypothetical protein